MTTIEARPPTYLDYDDARAHGCDPVVAYRWALYVARYDGKPPISLDEAARQSLDARGQS